MKPIITLQTTMMGRLMVARAVFALPTAPLRFKSGWRVYVGRDFREECRNGLPDLYEAVRDADKRKAMGLSPTAALRWYRACEAAIADKTVLPRLAV